MGFCALAAAQMISDLRSGQINTLCSLVLLGILGISTPFFASHTNSSRALPFRSDVVVDTCVPVTPKVWEMLSRSQASLHLFMSDIKSSVRNIAICSSHLSGLAITLRLTLLSLVRCGPRTCRRVCISPRLSGQPMTLMLIVSRWFATWPLKVGKSLDLAMSSWANLSFNLTKLLAKRQYSLFDAEQKYRNDLLHIDSKMAKIFERVKAINFVISLVLVDGASVVECIELVEDIDCLVV